MLLRAKTRRGDTGSKQGSRLPAPGTERRAWVDALEMPGELVLLLRVPLPLASHRQRQAAAAFAVEDFVAEPIESLHVALGPELGPGEYLVAAIRHADMAEWAPRAANLGQRLVPDTLGLPVPADESWAVRETGGRVLARLPDGTGFATALDGFETFWRAAARPQIVLFGGRLPRSLPIAATALQMAESGEAAFDLLQGRYATARGGWRHLAPRFAALAALTLAAHLLVLAADAHRLGGLADARETELRRDLAERVGKISTALPLDAAVRSALSAVDTEEPRFLPLLVQVSEALAPLAGEVGFRKLDFVAGSGELALTIEAGGLGIIQRAERQLSAAGLAVRAGAAMTGDAGAESRFLIGGSG